MSFSMLGSFTFSNETYVAPISTCAGTCLPSGISTMVFMLKSASYAPGRTPVCGKNADKGGVPHTNMRGAAYSVNQ